MRCFYFLMAIAFCFPLFSETPAFAQAAAETKLDAANNIVFYVQGQPAIKFSPQNVSCDANYEGAARYNKTSRAFEGCTFVLKVDGSGDWRWTPLSPKWVDVPLTDTNHFDPACHYRAVWGVTSSAPPVLPASPLVTYATEVTADAYIGINANNSISYIHYLDKTRSCIISGVGNPPDCNTPTWILWRIQKKCDY